MQVRRQLTSNQIDILNASVAEAALMLQSIRHETIRCERRMNDNLISEETRDIEKQSLSVLRTMTNRLNALFKVPTDER